MRQLDDEDSAIESHLLFQSSSVFHEETLHLFRDGVAVVHPACSGRIHAGAGKRDAVRDNALLSRLRGRGWMVRTVGAQQSGCKPERSGGGDRLRPPRPGGFGILRLRDPFRDSVPGQPSAGESRIRGHSAGLDPGRGRCGHSRWVVDLPARPAGNRSRRQTGRVGIPIRAIRRRIAEFRCRRRRFQAGLFLRDRTPNPRRGGDRPLERRVRLLEGFPPGGADAPGMVHGGRSRYGVPGELSRFPVPAKRGRQPHRSAWAAVWEADLFTLGAAGDSRPGRTRPRRRPSPPTGGDVVVHECGNLPHRGDRSGRTTCPDGMRQGSATGSRRPRSASWQVGGSARSPGAPWTSPWSFAFSIRRAGPLPGCP